MITKISKSIKEICRATTNATQGYPHFKRENILARIIGKQKKKQTKQKQGHNEYSKSFIVI